MSRGPGRAERAILDAVSDAVTPLGARRWLTLPEAWHEITGSDPTPVQANSLRRAASSLASKGLVDKAAAGDRLALFTSPLRWPELRAGTALVRASDTLRTQQQAADQEVSADSTEYMRGEGRRGRQLLAGMTQPPLAEHRGTWTYRPTQAQVLDAGRFARTKLPYGCNDLRKRPDGRAGSKTSVKALHFDSRPSGDDWGRTSRAGHEPLEDFLHRRKWIGTRGGALRTESTLVLAPAEGVQPDDLPLPPRHAYAAPFTGEELEEMRRAAAAGWEAL